MDRPGSAAQVGTGADLPRLIAHVGGRSTRSLDGDWKAIVDPYESGYWSDHAERRLVSESGQRKKAFFVPRDYYRNGKWERSGHLMRGPGS